jgi:hypothetical protein
MNLIFFLQIKIKKKWRNFLLFFLPCPSTMDEGGTGSRHTRLSLMAIIIHLIWPERYVLQLINVSIDYIYYYTSNSGGGTLWALRFRWLPPSRCGCLAPEPKEKRGNCASSSSTSPANPPLR